MVIEYDIIFKGTEKLTIEEFAQKAPTEVLAFYTSYREEAKKDKTFSLERSENDWWREISAYMQYVELEERFRRE